MSTIHRTVGLGTAALLAVALTACGSSGGSGAGAAADAVSTYKCDAPNADQKTTVSVTALPILSTGAVYLGVDQGFFEKNGLDVEMKTVAGNPASVAALQGGSTDFAFVPTIGLFSAAQSGLQLQAVAPFAGIAPGYWDKMQAGEEGYKTEVTALLANDDSGIDDPGDLEGKTLAVNDARGHSELTARMAIKLHGGDPSKTQFVTMTPADAYNALLAGKIDAAASIVPTFQGYEDKDLKIISWYGVETLHEGVTSFFAAKKSFVEENPDVTARFNCAMRESTTFANTHQDDVRQVVAREQKVASDTFDAAVVPYFYSSTDLAALDRYEGFMIDNEFLKDKIDPKSVIIPAALEGD